MKTNKLKAPKNQIIWRRLKLILENQQIMNHDLPIVVVLLDQYQESKPPQGNLVKCRDDMTKFTNLTIRVAGFQRGFNRLPNSPSQMGSSSNFPILSQEQLIEIRIFHQAGVSLKVWGRIQET